MRVKFDEMLNEFKRVLIKKGFSEEEAYESAKLFTENSRDGVYSHGVNRFPKVIEYIEKGYIDPLAKPQKIEGNGSYEIWGGNMAMGNLNAKIVMDRAIELAKEYGVGIIALRNTNHWMRGGAYGWQAADAGLVGMCWTNTMPNMPPWGGKDAKIGNNPFVIAIPRINGEHVVVDAAMSQFSYGKVEEYRLKGEQLPVVGGFNEEGLGTTDPAEIEESGRILPTGFWKGSGLSIALDLIATILSNGKSTTDIGRTCGGDEFGISQVFITIDPNRYNSGDITDETIDRILSDIKSGEPVVEKGEILYPGERVIKVRKENLENGIPVVEEIWETIKNL